MEAPSHEKQMARNRERRRVIKFKSRTELAFIRISILLLPSLRRGSVNNAELSSYFRLFSLLGPSGRGVEIGSINLNRQLNASFIRAYVMYFFNSFKTDKCSSVCLAALVKLNQLKVPDTQLLLLLKSATKAAYFHTKN